MLQGFEREIEKLSAGVQRKLFGEEVEGHRKTNILMRSDLRQPDVFLPWWQSMSKSHKTQKQSLHVPIPLIQQTVFPRGVNTSSLSQKYGWPMGAEGGFKKNNTQTRQCSAPVSACFPFHLALGELKVMTGAGRSSEALPPQHTGNNLNKDRDRQQNVVLS